MRRIFNKIDEWKIIQNEIEFEDNRLAESIMSLGNGYMGMRGNYEEMYSKDTHKGSYIAGVWFPDKTRVGWWKNGYPEYFGKVPNSVNYIGIDVLVNGKYLDLGKCEVEDFYRELDMKNGVLTRTFIACVEGSKIEVKVQRFLSIKRKELATIKYEVKALNFDGEITFIPYLDGDVTNEDSNYDERFWVNIDSDSNEYKGNVITRTKDNVFGTEVFTICANMINEVSKEVKVSEYMNKELYSSNTMVVDINKNETVSLVKYVAVTSTRDHNQEELLNISKNILNEEVVKGYEVLLKEHSEEWNKRWKTSDVKIEGDLAAQQGIRYNLFQLFSTYYGDDYRLNIGPKGFTGEKYGGATYWDTEAYCLPLYLGVADKHVSRNLLEYRHNQLEAAKENAKKLGLEGALYPMVTFNGEECHNEWEITFEEIHRNGSMIYAIYNYTNYTGDYSYIQEKGIDVIVEVARFWASRVHYAKRQDKYMIHGVTGPNEYDNNVNNNWYTNYLAKWCLEYAIENINKLQKECFESVIRNNVGEDELSKWATIAENMYLPYDEELQIIVQQDNFLDKELIEVKDLPKENLPLNQSWSWDKILRSCFIKQADVLQGIYYFGDKFSIEEKRRNFDFYERYTVHESSLSSCIYSIVGSEVGNLEKSYELYSRTARLDLDNYNNDTEDGLHITSMSGAWLAIVQGFAGMRTWNEILSFDPKLPKQWNSYSFNINYREHTLKIIVEKENVLIENMNDTVIELVVYGENYKIEDKLTVKREEKLAISI